jgi:hypothetical protein
MAGRYAPQKDRKLLWAWSGDQCAMRGCEQKLTQIAEDGSSFPVGVECHIVGHSHRGPRGQSGLLAKERASYDNLILLCPTCHTIVDNDRGKWSPDELHRLKSEHERRVKAQKVGAHDFPRLLKVLIQEIERNERRSGRATGYPERVDLDAVIARAEELQLSGPSLLGALYNLRQRTTDQEHLSGYPSPTSSTQYRNYYLPVAQAAKDAILRWLGRESDSNDLRRPRFIKVGSALSRSETAFAPDWKLRKIDGDPVDAIEWRFRGPHSLTDWRQVGNFDLERAHIAGSFDLTSPPRQDDLVKLGEIGLEIRFYWRERWCHELHRWPILRNQQSVRDLGAEILPPISFEAPDSSAGSSPGEPGL